MMFPGSLRNHVKDLNAPPNLITMLQHHHTDFGEMSLAFKHMASETLSVTLLMLIRYN